jgi:hypothetical protein
VVRASTSLSIRGRSTPTAYAVSGVLLGRGEPLAQQVVSLMSQALGATEWVEIDSARTGPRGRVRFEQPVVPGTSYYLSFAGGPRLAPSTSGVVVQ